MPFKCNLCRQAAVNSWRSRRLCDSTHQRKWSWIHLFLLCWRAILTTPCLSFLLWAKSKPISETNINAWRSTVVYFVPAFNVWRITRNAHPRLGSSILPPMSTQRKITFERRVLLQMSHLSCPCTKRSHDKWCRLHCRKMQQQPFSRRCWYLHGTTPEKWTNQEEKCAQTEDVQSLSLTATITFNWRGFSSTLYLCSVAASPCGCAERQQMHWMLVIVSEIAKDGMDPLGHRWSTERFPARLVDWWTHPA